MTLSDKRFYRCNCETSDVYFFKEDIKQFIKEYKNIDLITLKKILDFVDNADVHNRNIFTIIGYIKNAFEINKIKKDKLAGEDLI